MKSNATRIIALTAAALVSPLLFAGSQVDAAHAALATPSPYTTQVGLGVLRNGGNAIDAAVAVAFALAVVQPQAGNLGGGGYLTYYDAGRKAVWTLDFRETAPSAITPQSISDQKAVRNGTIGAGVPGTVAGLSAMHERFGSKPWRELLQPAIALANEGIHVDADLANLLAAAKANRSIDRFSSTGLLFYTNGKSLSTSDRLVQPDLAATLSRLADSGARDFYEGQLATKFVEAVQNAGGVLSPRDLREYTPIWRAPLRLRLGDNDIYAVGPPSGGGMQLAAALNILGGFDLVASGYQTPETIHVIAEAERRAAIDCAKYVGDPSATRVPYRDLMSADRAAGWRKSIRADRVTPTSLLSDPGSPVMMNEHATTFVIADTEGNVASVTTTLGDEFGGGFVVPGLGFFLNDALSDFTDPKLSSMSNAVAPGKRPTDSMTSVLVVRGGKPYVAIGTSGDFGVNSTTLQVLLNVLLYDKPLADAVESPRFTQRNQQDELDYERSTVPEATVMALNAMGHAVIGRESIGDVSALMFEAGRIIAVSDSRHTGAAGGF